ncbi:hypothetical protein [Lacticigenium naphthae]|uniref:hypothetical protein n=1 Tax=Lacticigenium naphthae TaxID=515351 RepID=UPI000402B670|nr:hypothetical protein [Lacticigenium naphthae]
MDKQALRYIAVGFLASSILLSGYDLLVDDTEASTPTAQNDAKDYKKLYEDLLTETEVANLSEEEKLTSELDSSKENVQDTGEDSQNETETEEIQADNTDKIVQTTIIIEDGQPSSIATNQLVNQGIVDSGTDFDEFMANNGYTTKIRPGRFSVDDSMTFEEIAQALTN